LKASHKSRSYQADTPSGKIYTPVFRWDNFLSIYFSVFGKHIAECYFATHDDGDKPNHTHVMKSEVESLPGNFDYWLKERDKPRIYGEPFINIDHQVRDYLVGVLVATELLVLLMICVVDRKNQK